MDIGDLAKPRHRGPSVWRSGTRVKERRKVIDPGSLSRLRRSPCDLFDGGAEPQRSRHIQIIAGILKPEPTLLRRAGLHTIRQLGPSIGLRGAWGKIDPELVKMGHADNLIRPRRNGADRWEKQRDENSQDPHHDDQLDEGESTTTEFF